MVNPLPDLVKEKIEKGYISDGYQFLANTSDERSLERIFIYASQEVSGYQLVAELPLNILCEMYYSDVPTGIDKLEQTMSNYHPAERNCNFNFREEEIAIVKQVLNQHVFGHLIVDSAGTVRELRRRLESLKWKDMVGIDFIPYEHIRLSYTSIKDGCMFLVLLDDFSFVEKLYACFLNSSLYQTNVPTLFGSLSVRELIELCSTLCDTEVALDIGDNCLRQAELVELRKAYDMIANLMSESSSSENRHRVQLHVATALKYRMDTMRRQNRSLDRIPMRGISTTSATNISTGEPDNSISQLDAEKENSPGAALSISRTSAVSVKSSAETAVKLENCPTASPHIKEPNRSGNASLSLSAVQRTFGTSHSRENEGSVGTATSILPTPMRQWNRPIPSRWDTSSGNRVNGDSVSRRNETPVPMSSNRRNYASVAANVATTPARGWDTSSGNRVNGDSVSRRNETPVPMSSNRRNYANVAANVATTPARGSRYDIQRDAIRRLYEDQNALGLPNLRSYLNSLVQMLNVAEEFRTELLTLNMNIPYSVEPKDRNLCSLLQRMRSVASLRTLTDSDIDHIRFALNHEFPNEEYMTKLQDPHGLFLHLLQCLPESIDCFDVGFVERNSCENCSAVTENVTIEKHIGLRMIGKGPFKIADMFAEKMQTTYPENCLCVADQWIQNSVKFTKLPTYFLAHIERFDWNKENGTFKLFHSVEGGMELNLAKFCDKNCIGPYEYELIGFCCHLGNNPNKGHYVSYVLQSGTWWEFNDEKVKPLQAADLYYNLRSSYVLLYRKKGH